MHRNDSERLKSPLGPAHTRQPGRPVQLYRRQQGHYMMTRLATQPAGRVIVRSLGTRLALTFQIGVREV